MFVAQRLFLFPYACNPGFIHTSFLTAFLFHIMHLCTTIILLITRVYYNSASFQSDSVEIHSCGLFKKNSKNKQNCVDDTKHSGSLSLMFFLSLMWKQKKKEVVDKFKVQAHISVLLLAVYETVTQLQGE